MDDEFDRRIVLKAGLGLGVSSLLSRFTNVQKAVAQELEAAGQQPSELAELYSLAPELRYLNHASIGTVPRAIRLALHRYLEICETNPWLYIWGDPWAEKLHEVRGLAAELLLCQAEEIALTHNTTEAFNLLAHGLPLKHDEEVLFSDLNHDGASVCWLKVGEDRSFQARRFTFPVDRAHSLTQDQILELYADQIRPKTKVVVLPHVDNTVGLKHPVAEIARLARERGVRYVAVDGAQTVGMLPVELDRLGVDAYATSGHKWIQAPKGLGITFLSRALQKELRPMWTTWGQKHFAGTVRVFEDYGTRGLPEILALGDALNFQHRLVDTKIQHHKRLWQHAQKRVDEAPELIWRSPRDWRLSAALYSFEVRGKSSRQLFKKLFEEHGFVFRPFEDAARNLNLIRLSPNLVNTVEELDQLFDLVTDTAFLETV